MEWLKQEKACPKGYRWFKRNYPDGLVVTKQNIMDLFIALSKRKNGFENAGQYFVDTVEWDSCLQMRFVLDHLKKPGGCDNSLSPNFRIAAWDKLPISKLTDIWWKDYQLK